MKGTVCMNKNHLGGALEWTWEELKDCLDYNQDKIDYIEKYSIIRPISYRNCDLCQKSISSGFCCKCGYSVCLCSSQYVNRIPYCCIKGHTLIIKVLPYSVQCSYCYSSTKYFWECKCGFIACTGCEKLSHCSSVCPNGHNLAKINSPNPNKCFRCFKEDVERSVCPTGYTLCQKCISELKNKEEANIDIVTQIDQADGKCQLCKIEEAMIIPGPCHHIELCYRCSGKTTACPICYCVLERSKKSSY